MGLCNLTKFIKYDPIFPLKLNSPKSALTTVRKFLPLRIIRKPHRMFSVSNGITSPRRRLWADELTANSKILRRSDRFLVFSPPCSTPFVSSPRIPYAHICYWKITGNSWPTVERPTAKWVVPQIHWMALRLARFRAAYNTSLLFWLPSRWDWAAHVRW